MKNEFGRQHTDLDIIDRRLREGKDSPNEEGVLDFRHEA